METKISEHHKTINRLKKQNKILKMKNLALEEIIKQLQNDNLDDCK